MKKKSPASSVHISLYNLNHSLTEPPRSLPIVELTPQTYGKIEQLNQVKTLKVIRYRIRNKLNINVLNILYNPYSIQKLSKAHYL